MPTAKKTVKKVTPKKVEKKELPKETGLKLSVFDTKGKALGSVSLPKEVFGAKVNENLMTQAVRVYLANQRRGTLRTKSRGEVNISTKKIYRQKGTGRARHGAASAPIFVGGGIAFGPKPRDFSLKLSKKARRAALFSALTSKLKEGEIRVVQGLEKVEPKTKNVYSALKSLNLLNKTLLVTPKSGKDFENVVRASRNIDGVRVTSSNLLNTYEVLSNKNLLFMKDSIDSLKEVFIKAK